MSSSVALAGSLYQALLDASILPKNEGQIGDFDAFVARLDVGLSVKICPRAAGRSLRIQFDPRRDPVFIDLDYWYQPDADPLFWITWTCVHVRGNIFTFSPRLCDPYGGLHRFFGPDDLRRLWALLLGKAPFYEYVMPSIELPHSISVPGKPDDRIIELPRGGLVLFPKEPRTLCLRRELEDDVFTLSQATSADLAEQWTTPARVSRASSDG